MSIVLNGGDTRRGALEPFTPYFLETCHGSCRLCKRLGLGNFCSFLSRCRGGAFLASLEVDLIRSAGHDSVANLSEIASEAAVVSTRYRERFTVLSGVDAH